MVILINNAKYAKPYILNDLNGGKEMFISIELDLTGKFYGSLRFMTCEYETDSDCTQYWNHQVCAYDDILVHKKYHLAVALETGAALILFDDTNRSHIRKRKFKRKLRGKNFCCDECSERKYRTQTK